MRLAVLFYAVVTAALAHSDCQDSLDPVGRSFLVTFEQAPPDHRRSEERCAAELENFITRDLEPFLKRTFPDVAGFEYSRFPFVNSVLVIFPPGARPSWAKFKTIERTSLQTALGAVASTNGPPGAFEP